jgi:cellulose synthase operon protein C
MKFPYLTVLRQLGRIVSSYRVLLLLFLLSSLPGCGVWDFVSAYFNTYYNARRVYSEAEEEIWALPETKDAGRNLLVPFTAQQGTRTKFTAVIEKCSKLLQYHPDSRLVDDVLLMIGNSFYYQGEFQRAERKYRELLDTYPESGLALQARAMLAYSYYKMQQPDSARALATALLVQATNEGEKDAIAAASLALGQLDLEAKAYERSRTYYQNVAEKGDTPGKRAHAYFRIAFIDSVLGEYGAAREAYHQAGKASDTYLGEFRGQFGAARMLRLEKDFEASLERLHDLRNNTNYREYFGEIDLQIGNVYRDQEDLDKALEQYAYVDTAYARTEQSALSMYEQGLIYETRFFLYDSAREAYTRGRAQYSAAAITQELTRRAEYLTRYATYRTAVARLDSMLTVALAPPDTMSAHQDSIAKDSLHTTAGDSLHIANRDSLKRARPGRDSLLAAAHDSSRASARKLNDTTHAASVQPKDSLHVAPASRVVVSPDSIRAQLASAIDDLANHFYASMEQPDSSAIWYNRLVAEFPKNPRVPRALYTLAQIARRDSTAGAAQADSLFREIADSFPDSPFADEARRLLGRPPIPKQVDEAEKSYQNGTRLLASGKNTAAIDTFRSVVHKFPSSVFASRAQYAVGWIYEYQTASPESAIANYDRLVKLYPSSELVSRVQPKLSEVRAAHEAAARKIVEDSIAAAQKKVAKDTTASVTPAKTNGQVPTPAKNSEVREESATPPGKQEPPSPIPPPVAVPPKEKPDAE